jgi:hypothetical protein
VTGSGVAFRLRSRRLSARTPLLPPAGHKPKLETKNISATWTVIGKHPLAVTAYAAWPLSHSQRDKTEGNYMATAKNSRILRFGSNTPTRRFRSSLSFPPPPKPSPLGFHRAHLSLRELKTKSL